MVTLQTLALTLCLTGAAGQTVLLDFYSDNCPPCREMAPVIAQFEAKGYPVQKINVDHQPQLAQQYGVKQWPTFLMLKDGREVGRVVGRSPVSDLLTLYQRAGVTPASYASQQSAPATLMKGSQFASNTRQAAPSTPTMPASYEQATTPAVQSSVQPAALRNELQTPNRSRLSVEQRAMAASVRIKISDGQTLAYGSGTIVDSQNGEALVLTCGHIFRGSQESTQLTVDLFNEEGAHIGTVPGQVIRYDMQRDVGLIAIKPGRDIEPMKVAGRGHASRRGDRVFSIGCDKGNPPTIRDSHVTHINKYLGPANIEVAVAPVDGRSGGGLYTSDGTLIGVCNAAAPEADEGLYAAVETIHAELIAAKLDFIIPQNGSVPQQPLVATSPQTDPVMPRGMAVPTASDQNEMEVTIFLRPRNGQEGEVVHIRQPSPELLDLISRQREGQFAEAAPSRQRATVPNTPIMRGQNEDAFEFFSGAKR